MAKALSPEELAERWGVDVPDVEAELTSGCLRSFVVNGKRRIPTLAVDEFEQRASADARRPTLGAVPPPHFSAGAPFRHVWPNRMEEHYPQAFETRLERDDGPRYIRIGFGTRATVGQQRRRAVVFLSDRPFREQGRAVGGRPVVEFVGVDDYERSHLLASLTKTPAGKEVHVRSDLPDDYAGMEIVPYNSVVTGPYSHRGLAVLLPEGDLAGMLRHGLIRARSMGLG